jgi:hypothetical protein
MNIQPESELMLACLRLEPETQKAERLQAFSASDWEATLAQARAHDVSSLLAWHLDSSASDPWVPEHVHQELRQRGMAVAGMNLLIYHELASLLKSMWVSDIPVIVLKGVHLAEIVYPNIALRPIGDIDLLVDERDMIPCSEILLENGFLPSRRFRLEIEVGKHLHIPPFVKPGGATVELHWSVIPPDSPIHIDLPELWARALPVKISGAPALSLSPEDLLLQLCLHFYQHEFRLGIRHLYDLVETVVFYGADLDWEQVAARASQWNAGKPTYLALHLARQLLNAPIPPEVLKTLRPGDFNPQIDALARKRVLKPAGTPPVHTDLARLRGRQPLRVKVRAVLNTLFPYPEYVARKYSLAQGSKKVYFYYLVRLKDLLVQYGAQFLRLASGDEATMALSRQENELTDWLLST